VFESSNVFTVNCGGKFLKHDTCVLNLMGASLGAKEYTSFPRRVD
jgi:hypothetical protein